MEPVTVSKIKRRNLNLIIPAITGANVRMIGKYNPTVKVSHPYFS